MSDDADPPSPSESPPPPAPPPTLRPATTDAKRPLTGLDAYNVVSDTVIGVNIRPRDNLVQLLAVVIGLVLGTGIGALLSPRDRITGAAVGGVCGLIAGLLLSGIALMIYRAVRHARGRHD